MQLSHYLKPYSYEEKPGHLLLFSTKRLSKILLPEETFRSIEKDMISPSDEVLLSRLGMIVEDREEEKRNMLSFLDRMNRNNPVLNVTVVLNLDCNFACIYCYEGDMKGNLYMSEETGDQLIRFIKGNFPEHKTSLIVDFYGGEPLLSLRLIKSLSERLKSFTESKGASYTFTLVTNGSLFKRKVAEELVPLGLKSVQITLDGPAENHNKYRPFRSGADSFDIIIKNIRETCDLVNVNIVGNYDKESYENFPLLLDYLQDASLPPEKIGGLKFSPVMNRPEGDTSPVDYNEGCMSIDEPWLLTAGAFLREEILRRGYHTPKVKHTICAIENKDTYVVNYDGAIYKCPAFIGKQGFAVGDLTTGVSDYSNSYKLGIWKNEECAECVYLPLCFGGCRYMSFVRDGSIDKLDCKKSYLDASLETMVKQDVKYTSIPASVSNE
jgi:uncharacterized protein